MKQEDFVKLGLDNEQAKKAGEAVSEMLKGFVPKHRFDEVNTAKKSLEEDMATRDKQLEGLKNSTGDIDNLKDTIKKLQDDNKINVEKHKAELQKINREAIDGELLTKANAKNAKAVKGLLDEIADNVTDEEYKTLRSEAIKNLQRSEDSSFLFDEPTKDPNFKGLEPGQGNKPPEGKDISEMTYTELCEFQATNPNINFE